jgi:hypothetical protein
MHKSATKCNKTLGKWCKNKHGASKIIDTFETYQVLLQRWGNWGRRGSNHSFLCNSLLTEDRALEVNKKMQRSYQDKRKPKVKTQKLTNQSLAWKTKMEVALGCIFGCTRRNQGLLAFSLLPSIPVYRISTGRTLSWASSLWRILDLILALTFDGLGGFGIGGSNFATSGPSSGSGDVKSKKDDLWQGR